MRFRQGSSFYAGQARALFGLRQTRIHPFPDQLVAAI